MSVRNEANWLEVRHRQLMSTFKNADLSDLDTVKLIQERVDVLRRQLNNLAGDIDLTIAGLIKSKRGE